MLETGLRGLLQFRVDEFYYFLDGFGRGGQILESVLRDQDIIWSSKVSLYTRLGVSTWGRNAVRGME